MLCFATSVIIIWIIAALNKSTDVRLYLALIVVALFSSCMVSAIGSLYMPTHREITKTMVADQWKTGFDSNGRPYVTVWIKDGDTVSIDSFFSDIVEKNDEASSVNILEYKDKMNNQNILWDLPFLLDSPRYIIQVPPDKMEFFEHF